MSDETRLGLEMALHSLTHEEREIVCLKYFDGLSYDELATHLQIPRGTVMSRLFNARRRLQGKLAATLIREQEV
jgi:RNA polymerase sigma-70 factor (ECF subfamily)